MAKKELKVFYDDRGTTANRMIDEALATTLAEFGYKKWASGFDLACYKRDLAFEMDDTIKEVSIEKQDTTKPSLEAKVE